MAIQQKRNNAYQDAVGALGVSIKLAGVYVDALDLAVKVQGVYQSILAPAINYGAQIVGAPIVGTPMLLQRAVFSGAATINVVLQTWVDGVLAATGAAYTPVVGDIGKLIYVVETATNSYGSKQSTSPARICVAALDVPVLLDSYDGPLSNYAISANTTPALETTGQVQGAGRVRMTGTGNGTATTLTCTRTLTVPDPTTLNVLAYCSSKTAASLTTGTSLSLTRTGVGNAVSQSDSATKFRAGNHWLASHISEYPAFIGLGAGAMTVRESIQQQAPYTTPADGAVDALMSNCGGRPTLVLTVDDWTTSAYAELFQLLQARSWLATFFMPGGQVGLPGKGTWSQALEMDRAGHDFGGNTMFDVAASTFSTAAAYVADLAACRALMRAAGLSERAINTLALSNGIWLEDYLVALEADGWVMARTTEPQTIYTRMGFGNQAMTMPSFSITGSVTLAAAQAQIDLIISRKSTGFFHGHDFSNNPSPIGWHKTLKLIPWMDYAIAKRDAGLLDIVTVSQLRLRDAGAVLPF